MNITDFVKNMNKTFKKYDVKFVANYADVYDSVAVFIKCKEPHIVADYLYDNHFKGVIGTNIGILHDEIVVTFFDFSEYSSNEIEHLIVDAIFDANAKYRLFEGKNTMKKSLTEKELKMDVWEWGEVKGTDEELCNHIAEYAEEKGIEYMEITEDEFEYLKKDYLKKYKSMKESKDTDFFNAMAKKFNFTKDELKRYKDKTYISVIGILFDRIRSVPIHSDEWYNAMNDCWEGIQVAGDNGFNVDYEKKTYDKIMMSPNYNRESKKSDKKSLTEKMLQDICNSWVIGKVKGEFKGRNYCHEGNDYSLYNIGNIIEDALRDNYIVEFDGDDKTKTVIFNLINDDGKNVGTLEIFPDERYSVENYEDGFNWEDLNMKEIIKDFEDMLGYKIEYLKSDKRFDYSDRFWYKESKKSVRKSIKESVKPEIQLMVNNIIDELIGEYSSKEWDALSANEKFDIVRTEYFSFGYKSKYLSEVRDLVIENMNHPFNVVFESKKSARKPMNEENNRQKVTEGIMNYFKDVFPLIEKHDAFRFSMYTKKDIKIGVELFKDYINVLLFNLDGKGNLDEYIEIPRETYGTIENEILYDSDAIWGYLEQYKLVK